MRASPAGGRDTWLSGFKSHRFGFCGWTDYGSDGLSDLADSGDSEDLSDLDDSDDLSGLDDPAGLRGSDDLVGLRGSDDPGSLSGPDDSGDLSNLDNSGGSSDLNYDHGGKQDDSGCSGGLDGNSGFGYHGDSDYRQCVFCWHQLWCFHAELGNSFSALSPPPPKPSDLPG